VIEQILPTTVVVEETRKDLLDCTLFAEEQASVGRAVEKRRREFTTARACARRALARLGLPVQSIPTGKHGAPRWPEGVVGSITHCRGYCACALAREIDVIAIGIDAEPDDALPSGVLGEIVCAEERESLVEQMRAAPAINWDRLLFSAKESVYKAWYPLTGRRLGFEDAVVTIAPAEGTFFARLLHAGPSLDDGSPPDDGSPLSLEGRWLVRDGFVLTAIALTRR
jgi:4'-phosphopantetheinyl transferase EntD